MGIISSLDSQSFLITRRLLERQSPSLASKLIQPKPEKYPLDEINVELEIDTINEVIDELMCIGQQWLADTDNKHHEERKQILAYILQQWVKVGQDAKRLSEYSSNSRFH